MIHFKTVSKCGVLNVDIIPYLYILPPGEIQRTLALSMYYLYDIMSVLNVKFVIVPVSCSPYYRSNIIFKIMLFRCTVW